MSVGFVMECWSNDSSFDSIRKGIHKLGDTLITGGTIIAGGEMVGNLQDIPIFASVTLRGDIEPEDYHASLLGEISGNHLFTRWYPMDGSEHYESGGK